MDALVSSNQMHLCQTSVRKLGSRCPEESILAREGSPFWPAPICGYGRASGGNAWCALLLLEPGVSVPPGVLAGTPWEQSGGWPDLSIVPGFRASRRC